MNELQLRTTEMFDGVRADIYENANYEMFMTSAQLGRCLGYAEPRKAISKIIDRNPYLGDAEFSGVVKLGTPKGGTQRTRVFNEDGIYEVTLLANTEKSIEFRRWIRNLIKSLRRGDIQLATGNITYSPELFEAALQKHLGVINDRLTDLEKHLEERKPSIPSFWSWKKNVANKAIDTICAELNIDCRTAYDMVYDNMTGAYGFDKSCAMSKFCSKYGVDEVSTIDAIADVPEYATMFVSSAYNIINNAQSNNAIATRVVIPTMSCESEIKNIIEPLIEKYHDKSARGARTYGKVYKAMRSDRSWKQLMSRRKCHTKKELIESDSNLMKDFITTVDKMLKED